MAALEHKVELMDKRMEKLQDSNFKKVNELNVQVKQKLERLIIKTHAIHQNICCGIGGGWFIYIMVWVGQQGVCIIL